MMTVCPTCQSVLPPGRADGLCAACFFGAAIGPVTGGVGVAADQLAGIRFRLPGLAVGEELARGGMGIVYRAEQSEPRRTVALKILSPQWAGNEGVRERFRREAQAMANLDHPNILPVYAVGEHDGLPWFTMKLAAGGSLAERGGRFVGQGDAAAILLVRLARALAFAHERGVLHRDLKPANILFDSEDNPNLADFGLAKHLAAGREALALTLDAEVLGTPAYLAPEVAAGSTAEGTTASDVYSLGAILYELLAGRPPHEADSLPALLRLVADGRPTPLMEVPLPPPRDLRAICERALAREPERRYASARELADDLERFLRRDEVHARELTVGEALWHWARRHPVVASLLVTVGALLGALFVVTAFALAGRDRAEANLRSGYLAEAEGVRRSHLPGFRRRALDLVAAAAAPGESEELRSERRSQAVAALAYPEPHQHPLPTTPGEWELTAVAPGHAFYGWTRRGGPGWRVTRSADGGIVADGAAGGRAGLVSRDGRRLALQREGGWLLCDLTASPGRLEAELPGEVEDLSEDGELVAYCFPGPEQTWQAEVRETLGGRVRFQLRGLPVPMKLRFNPAGDWCAVAPSAAVNHTNLPYSVRLHRCADGSVARELSAGLANCVWAMAWSRDGRWLGVGERGGATYVWDSRTGNPRHTIRGPGANLWQIAFSEDNRYLATVGDDQLLTVFELGNGLPVMRGGGRFADGNMRLAWSAAEPELFGPLKVDDRNTFLHLQPGAFSGFRAPDAHGGNLGLAVSPDGRWLAVGDARHARLWDLRPRVPRLVRAFATDLWNAFVFSADSRSLFGVGEAGVFRWAVGDDGIGAGTGVRLLAGRSHQAVTLDRAGRLLAVEDGTGVTATVLTLEAGSEVGRLHFAGDGRRGLALTADGTRLAAAGEAGLHLWQPADGQLLLREARAAHSVAFSPDDQWLLAALASGGGGEIYYEVWSPREFRRIATLSSRPVAAADARAAFSPDGRWVATGHAFGRIALWSVGDWKLVTLLKSPSGQPVGRLAFSADSSRLFSAGTGGVVEEWNLARLATDLEAMGLGW
jgi:WD40 repeat protein